MTTSSPSQTLTIAQAIQLAVQYHQAGQLPQAEALYRQLLQAEPKNSAVLHLYGVLKAQQGQQAEGIRLLKKALKFNDKEPLFHVHLANVLSEQQRYAEAKSHYQHALRLAPNHIDAHYNLATTLKHEGFHEQAAAHYRHVLALNPAHVESYNNLGIVLQERGELDEAMHYLQQAITLNAAHAEVHYNLATVLWMRDKLQEAVTHYYRSIQLRPQYREAYSNLLFGLNYLSDYTPEEIFLEHQRFNQEYALPLAPLNPVYTNERIPKKRLKIGYVSTDFRRHAVAYFTEAILAHHDHEQFEIFCYHDHTKTDEVTKRFKKQADHWIECSGRTDLELAQLVKQQQIDILVDLLGHVAKNRLGLFARKPAPIQISYLGYPNTTGLTAIDYRIVDNYVEPDDRFSAERPIRMKHSYFCYHPASELEGCPEVNNLPSLDKGYVTFGSFNNRSKLSQEILTLWATIMQAVPQSKLLVKAKSLTDYPVNREDFIRQCADLGIASDRLTIANFTPTFESHLAIYHDIDIALDSYPYNGATTTCEALWMGIPVVTLVGKTHVSRMGLSILSTVDLTELVTNTPEDYVKTVIQLANNRNHLQFLRKTMRERLKQSPLLDGLSFTQELESAYRVIWNNWCA